MSFCQICPQSQMPNHQRSQFFKHRNNWLCWGYTYTHTHSTLSHTHTHTHTQLSLTHTYTHTTHSTLSHTRTHTDTPLSHTHVREFKRLFLSLSLFGLTSSNIIILHVSMNNRQASEHQQYTHTHIHTHIHVKVEQQWKEMTSSTSL